MHCFGKYLRRAWTTVAILIGLNLISHAGENDLPAFGRDTVLVWQTQNADMSWSFVARIAIFSPDRFLEWESENDQGTVFMPARDIEEAKDYTSNNLFEGGVDKKSRKSTTLWLSRRIYRELKSKGKAKCRMDGVGATLEYLGQGRLTVEVNKKPKQLPVIKVSNGRGAELWFLDLEENPLMVKHMVRSYNKTLTIISTNRPDTLRWIKGEKLTNPPQMQ